MLLLDPFYPELQVALFRSSTHFDDEYLKQNDVILKSIIQSNRSRKGDNRYKTYLWQQFPNKIIRSKLLEPATGRVVEDSDIAEEADKPLFEVAIDNKFEYLKIPMIQDSASFIYYVTSQYK